MNITFRKLNDADLDILLDFIESEEWPWHGWPPRDRETLRASFHKGDYNNDKSESWWILFEGERAGMLRIFELNDDCPTFDLRLKKKFRGLGIGNDTMKWLAEYIFSNWPDKSRIAGYTRQDNEGMRRLFRKNNWAKEAHHRKAWPGKDKIYDSVGYGILREDWEKGTVTPVEWDGD